MKKKTDKKSDMDDICAFYINEKFTPYSIHDIYKHLNERCNLLSF